MFLADTNADELTASVVVDELPVGWADAAEPDAFVTMAAGRSPFRFADLVELRRLIDGLSD